MEIQRFLEEDFFEDFHQNFKKMKLFRENDKVDFLSGVGNAGGFYCESFSSKVSYGQDGKRVEETQKVRKAG